MIGTIALTVIIALGQAGWQKSEPAFKMRGSIGTTMARDMVWMFTNGQDIGAFGGNSKTVWKVPQKRTQAQCRLVWTDRSGKQWRGRVIECEEVWKHYRAMLEKRRNARIHVETVRGRKR